MYFELRMRILQNLSKMAAEFVGKNIDFNGKIQKNCGSTPWELAGIVFSMVENSKLCKNISVLRDDK